MDPFVCLAVAGAVTKSIKLATGVALVVQRDPIQLAKEIASLDQISNGRFCSVLAVAGMLKRWRTMAPILKRVSS
jgi:alkanesulfonate monooxygenase SsuD/methylene tetrahydromethanopterin reductase-like flavin-dependent oxidoreductase (luciferase family)